MPKEQTHWILATQAAQSLERGPIKDIIEKHPNLYLLGAVSPDTPMYALHDMAQFAALAQQLHGRYGENTFKPLTHVLEYYQDAWSPGLWAFVLGTLSHIMADAVYHPWVEYYTGSSGDVPESDRHLSLSRHRELESYIDLYHMNATSDFKPYSFMSLWRHKEMPSREFLDMVQILYFNSNGRKDLGRVFRSHGFLQWCFMQKSLARATCFINELIGRKGDAWVTLFYPYSEPKPPAYFQQGLTYRHTVTGRAKSGTLDELAAKAIRVTARLFQIVEKHREQGTALDFFRRIKGPSLETGLVGVPTTAIVHYDLETSLDEILGQERVQK